jgi:hypothetical protein
VQLPDGRKVAIFGDSFSGNTVGVGEHYRSVAVEVTGFDAQGRPIYGRILTGPQGSGNELLSLPEEAKKIPGVVDTLPAGTLTIGNKTYMMVVGTDKDLKPVGGSWLTEVTNDPGAGWKPIAGSWRAWEPGNPLGGAPTQLSGYQGSDGKVYIAANSFDRGVNRAFHGVTMYRVDPGTITDRSTWQPWTGTSWGAPGAAAIPVTKDNFGELSFREIDGRPVLSGFNRTTGSVEVRVGVDPHISLAPARQRPLSHTSTPARSRPPTRCSTTTADSSSQAPPSTICASWSANGARATTTPNCSSPMSHRRDNTDGTIPNPGGIQDDHVIRTTVRATITVIAALGLAVVGGRVESQAQPPPFPDLGSYTPVSVADYSIGIPNPGRG